MPRGSRLIERVGFEAPQTGNDGGGGVANGFTEQFERRAEYIHLRGGEAVIAARLQGQHTQIIRVRDEPEARAVTTSWRIVDKRNGDVFNIREIAPAENDRRFRDFTCQKGVAT